MILNSSRRLQINLTTAATSVNMPVIVDYTDYDGVSSRPDSQTASTNGATAVDICFSPTGNVRRWINQVQVYNRDTAAKGIQINLIDGTNSYQLQDVTLQVDDVLTYNDSGSWQVTDVNGNLKSTSTLGGILSTSPNTGIGYATGAGAAVTQLTNRSTGITINAVTGAITTNNTSLAAGASAVFTVTNSAVAIGDVVNVSIRSGSTNAAGVAGITSIVVVAVAAGSFNLAVNNESTTTAETGAIIINFALVKAVSA
jgi:hypothetical protein